MCLARFRNKLFSLAPASRARLNGLSQRARRMRRRFLESKNGTRVMSQSNGDGVAVVADVVVVRRSDFGWWCEIAGLPVFFGAAQIAPDFLMPADGVRGPVKVVTSAVAPMWAMGPRAVRST